MKSLAELLKNNTFNSPLLKGIRAAKVVEAGEAALIKIFGNEILDHARPAYYRNTTIAIACLSTTIASEIKFNEKIILEEINKSVPGAEVARIRYLS